VTMYFIMNLYREVSEGLQSLITVTEPRHYKYIVSMSACTVAWIEFFDNVFVNVYCVT